MEIKEFKGKFLSQWSKIIAVLIMLASWFIKLATNIDIDMDDAVKVALFVALMFYPIDVSIWLSVFAPHLNRKTIPDDGKGESDAETERTC